MTTTDPDKNRIPGAPEIPPPSPASTPSQGQVPAAPHGVTPADPYPPGSARPDESLDAPAAPPAVPDKS